jgi:hypothetical protein
VAVETEGERPGRPSTGEVLKAIEDEGIPRLERIPPLPPKVVSAYKRKQRADKQKAQKERRKEEIKKNPDGEKAQKDRFGLARKKLSGCIGGFPANFKIKNTKRSEPAYRGPKETKKAFLKGSYAKRLKELEKRGYQYVPGLHGK